MKFTKERFSRQTILKGFGIEAQQKLQKASVLVIGIGGLGCPIVEYLAAVGIGKIGLVDDDTVTLSNLNRQIIFGENHCGKNKAIVAAEHIHRKYSKIETEIFTERWTSNHCVQYFPAYDIILDATDNFATRYMINDAAFLLNKPLIYGAVSEYEGQVAVFNIIDIDGIKSSNYRDLFPTPPGVNEIKNCAETGVLGMIPGIIGCMQALEAVKIITGIGQPLVNKILTYDGLTQESFILEYENLQTSQSFIPNDLNDFIQTDYELQCGIDHKIEISWSQALSMLKEKNVALVDVRDYEEQPRLDDIEHFSIPLSELNSRINEINTDTIIFLCQSGKRSLQAIQMSKQSRNKVNMFSIKGGIHSIK